MQNHARKVVLALALALCAGAAMASDPAGEQPAKRGLLPLFTTRNLDHSSNCVPHQTTVGGMTFKVDVLRADRKAAAH